MPDMAVIGAALSSLKSAVEIAKFLRETDLSMDRAEIKLKLADMISALADTKIELAGLQESLIDKDNRISELEAAFQLNRELVRAGDAYYVKNSEGKATGRPYCLRCWDNDHKQRQLINDAKKFRFKICTGCGLGFADHTVRYQGTPTDSVEE